MGGHVRRGVQPAMGTWIVRSAAMTTRFSIEDSRKHKRIARRNALCFRLFPPVQRVWHSGTQYEIMERYARHTANPSSWDQHRGQYGRVMLVAAIVDSVFKDPVPDPLLRLVEEVDTILLDELEGDRRNPSRQTRFDDNDDLEAPEDLPEADVYKF